MLDLHRHGEFSTYDGSGKAEELAKIAVELGYTSLGLSDHGTTSGLVQHYDACKKVGIKPILGVESYFLPKWKEQTRGYHLCLFAKDLEGYKNINQMQSEGEFQKYYQSIVDFEMFSRLSKGVICTSACVAGYIPQCIIKGNLKQAEKAIYKFKEYFGDDFYLEIQPYVISDPGLQEKVNVELIKLGKKTKTKCIMTSDSHRGRKEDLEVYLKMHELKLKPEDDGKERLEHVRGTYAERYMPTKKEMCQRFVKMHSKDFGKETAIKMAKSMIRNLQEIEDKVDGDIIDKLAEMPSLPKFDSNQDSHKLLLKNVKDGLKERGVNSKRYIERAKEELKVIKSNEFEDYFLIVQDYTRFAKEKGIAVGPGRGSGCNCLVNYALGITDVDPILFNLDFRRFIREGKKTLPDIDIDFETARRQEVLDYIVSKYEGQACQIASYGMYKVDNLINDLVKRYRDLSTEGDIIKMIKKIIKKHTNTESQIDLESLMMDSDVIRLNKEYKGLFDAFCFMYNKVKYIGTHAAGAAVSKDSIYYYTAVRYDKTNNRLYSSYNLVDLERCGIVKYDILGLKTLSSLNDLRKATGHTSFDTKWLTDKKILENFASGNSYGIFQYSEPAAQGLLEKIRVDNFNDVVAASAMNRPGPLSQGIPEVYASAKETWNEQENKPPYAKYLEETYGCILYQEQVNSIAVEYGGLSWNQADKLRKMDDPASLKSRLLIEQNYDTFLETFVKGMKKIGVSEEDAKELFDNFLNYAFNKGHAVGYALISMEEMYYKTYNSAEFWFSKMKHSGDDSNYAKCCINAVKDDIFIFLPHVNYSTPKTRIRKFEGEKTLQQGLSDIKGVGEKASAEIMAERKRGGIFTSLDNFIDRCQGRVVNKGVVAKLQEQGALVFDKEIYLKRCMKYNSTLLSKSQN